MSCPACGGTGIYRDYMDDGAGDIFYIEHNCHECIEKGRCPQCTKESKRLFRAYVEGYADVCEHCGWSMEELKKEEGKESENNGSSHWMEECPKSGEPCTCENECIYLRQKGGETLE